MLVGLAWIRLSDLVHETCQKKVEFEFDQAGWATAENTAAHRQVQPPCSSDATRPLAALLSLDFSYPPILVSPLILKPAQYTLMLEVC